MALSIQTNYANLVGQNSINKTNSDFNTSIERLTTGFRINSAADDAAGLQISNRLEAQGRGMGVAMRNANDAISQMQTAEGALEQMTDIAYRMNDLATQAANGTASDADRDAMQSEFAALGEELSSLMENTNMGGQKLLDSTDGVFANSGGVTYQVGSTSGEQLDVNLSGALGDVGDLVDVLGQSASAVAFTEAYDDVVNDDYSGTITTALGDNTSDGTVGDASGYYAAYYTAENITGTATAAEQAAAAEYAIAEADSDRVDEANAAGKTASGDLFDTLDDVTAISNQDVANNAIDTLSGFIDNISSARSEFGANINRLDYTISNLASMQENTAAAKSNIMDTDMASESSAMSKNQMLMQMGTQMLSTTKMVPQLAMGLLG